ncbi:MAG: YIP1 family protein [Candidatus Aenigmarchaeota archaeon]|nr:YIP1 family protein [Candidatus Aenigmarchaeota archaeon]
MKAVKSIFHNAMSVVTGPDKFFASVKKEKGLAEPMKYYAVISSVPLLVLAVVMAAGFSIMPMPVMGGAVIAGLAILWLLQIAVLFLSAGIMHIAVKMLGGKSGYANTYRALAYGATPAALFGIIPFIGIVASLYSLYIEVKGISALQKMSTGRAVVAVLVVPLIAVVVAAAFAFWSVSFTRMMTS